MSNIVKNQVLGNFVGGNLHIGDNNFGGSGNLDITHKNGKVLINGQDASGLFGDGQKEIHIHITGDVNGYVRTMSGNVTVGGLAVRAESMSGNIRVDGDIAGSVETMSGDVSVKGSIGGSVKSMSGDITK